MTEFESLSPRGHRRAWVAVILSLTGVVAVYLALWPRVITVTDEAQYLQLATMYASGQRTVARVDPFSQTEIREVPSRYVPGVPLLMAGPIRLFGWRGAYVVPLAATILCTLILAKWLSDSELSPIWALLYLAYLPTAALTRVGMSDIPSAAVSAVVFWLLWRPRGNGWLIAGLLAGASVLFRETNAIVFAPFVIASLRAKPFYKQPFAFGVLIGGFGAMALLYTLRGGQNSRAGETADFAVHYILPHLPHYLLAMLVMLPGGLIAVALYSGRWQAALMCSVGLVILMFSAWWYVGAESGVVRGLILGAGRFCLPITPLVIFAIASQANQLAAVGQRLPPLVGRIVPFGLAAVVCLETSAIQWVLARWAGSQADLVASIRTSLPKDAVVLSDFFATNKALSPILDSQYAPIVPVDYQMADRQKIDTLLQRGVRPWVVMLYREDSPAIKPQSDAARQWTDQIAAAFNMRIDVDRKVTATDQLWIGQILARK